MQPTQPAVLQASEDRQVEAALLQHVRGSLPSAQTLQLVEQWLAALALLHASGADSAGRPRLAPALLCGIAGRWTRRDWHGCAVPSLQATVPECLVSLHALILAWPGLASPAALARRVSRLA